MHALYARFDLPLPTEDSCGQEGTGLDTRFALVQVAPDERRGAPAVTITTFAGDLEAVLRVAREGLGDPLYPLMPVEIVDLVTGGAARPNWDKLPWLAVAA